ncbi:hypothetical protein DH2020_028120 [Rehmannia glutinosa]|uniref:Core Histone H2A/H2B/H3 domain-containing protein n=1 Tax=Rehmannia glutinosa TaxID=99300 RepID=A0ABR0VS83_REHGL
MAPKRRSGRSVKTVTTTNKVVEETVQVVVTPGAEDRVELLSSSTKENKNVEISTLSPHEEQHHLMKTIPIHEQEDDDDEDETQPASEPETAPTPPRKEAPPPKPETPVQEKSGKNKSGKRRRKRGGAAVDGGGEGYKRYVFKVMKQVHPEMGISSKAMTVINNLMGDIFERLAEEAARLQKYTRRSTMSSREVQGAVKLVLPGELGKHAIAEGTKAVTNYVSYVSGKKA